MFVVKYRKVWFTLSAILLALSFYTIFAYGLRLSIDFTGGAITEVHYDGERPNKESLEGAIETLGLGGFSVLPLAKDAYVVRTRDLTPTDRQNLESTLGRLNSNFTIARQNTVGPIAGAELQSKAVKAVVVAVLLIVLFITFAFRKVSKPVASWKYGLATVIALAHDVVIPTGIFVFLGHFYGVEMDLLFVSGLLAILGYSVHDSIVVFDRLRENLKLDLGYDTHGPFEEIVGKSVSQTFARSINTSVTIFITLFVLYLVGPTVTEHFTLLLIIGIIVGTYSSIFVASPLLVTFSKLQKNSEPAVP